MKQKNENDLNMIENVIDCSVKLISTIDEMFLFF